MNDAGALRFAEKLLALLDSMNVSASYKFATLLALLDVVAESVNDAGEPPTTVSGRAVGRRVVELYWPQSRTFGAGPDGVPKPLGQSAMRDIPEKLAEWRRQHNLDSLATLDDARSADPTGWALLEQELVGVVVGMPLAKLQRFGGGRTVLEDRFIYDFGWPDEVSHSVVARSRFDDRMTLRPGVGGWLISLAGLLRPVVEARWTAYVAKRNRDLVDAAQVEDFLFGASRISLDRLRGPMLRAQRHACFYCRKPIAGQPEVDHFLPWSRHPDNTVDNLVAAHRPCNGSKSASLAAVPHLQRWLQRFTAGSEDDRRVAEVARQAKWPRRPDRVLATARASYFSLYDGTPLWEEEQRFVSAVLTEVSAAFRHEPPQPAPDLGGPDLGL